MKYFPLSLIAIMCVLIMIDPRKGILFALIIRPVIDCFWEAQYSFLGLRPTEFISVLFPSLIFVRMLMTRPRSFLNAPFSGIWIVYIFYQLLSAILILTIGEGMLESLDFYFRAFNGFIGFYLFQEYFNRPKEFKRLLLGILIAGLFPMAQSFYQNVMGGSLRTDLTVGNTVRSIGLYHDAFSLIYYSFQILTAVILYVGYFGARHRMSMALAFFPYGLLVFFTIYKLFSKSALFTAGLWLFIQNLFAFRVKWFLCVVLVVIALVAIKPDSFLKIGTVFSKEISAIEGTVKVEQTFQGRWYSWEESIAAWEKLPLILKLIGDTSSNYGMHNDFLRVLMATGIFGLSIYLVLLGVITFRLFRNCLRDRCPLNLMGLMLISMWITYCIGLVPGAYPGYQWYVWGFIGLALRGLDGYEADANLRR